MYFMEFLTEILNYGRHLGSGKMFVLLWRDQALLIGMVLVPIPCLRMTLSRNHCLQVS